MTLKKILIINDEIDITELVEYSLLTKTNWEILEVNSASEGIRKAKSYKPNVILLNMQIVNMKIKVITLLNKLKESQFISNIPIIVFTDKALSNKEEKNSKYLKVAGVIKKPINLITLEKEIEVILNSEQEFLDFCLF